MSLLAPEKLKMKIPACGLRNESGHAKYSIYLQHVGHILLSTTAWSHWTCCAYVMWFTCMYVGSAGLDISSQFGQAIRGPETLNIRPHSYLLEKLSKRKHKISLTEEMVVLSLSFEDCVPITVYNYLYIFHLFPKRFLYHQTIFLDDFITSFFFLLKEIQEKKVWK